MITYTLPPKSAKQFTASGIIEASVFGLEYNFDQSFDVKNAVSGMLYYIERVSFAPSIEEYTYIGAIDTGVNVPRLLIVDGNNSVLNGEGSKLIKSMGEAPLELWISSDSPTVIRARVRGTIKQTSDLVTVPKIRLAVSVSGYEIPSSLISGAFRDGISGSSLTQFRGGR